MQTEDAFAYKAEKFMERKKLTLPMFLLVLAIFLINGGISTANLIQYGAVQSRIIPVVCWFLAAIFWTVAYLRMRSRESIDFLGRSIHVTI